MPQNLIGMQILNFRYANVDFFKTPHIQIRFLGKDPVFKYEFLVLFIHPWQGVSLVLKYLPPMPMLPLDLTNIACFISEILAVSWLGVVYILALSGKEGKGG